MKRYYTDTAQIMFADTQLQSDLYMINAFPLPVFHLKRLPPLFCLSFGAFLGVLITAFVVGERSSQKHGELIEAYGSALTEWVAKDSSEHAANNNLVGLHAILLDVVDLPRVKLAVVHNVEQVLLVQAGQAMVGGDLQVFSAPIPFGDSMAGHVSITVDVGFEGESAFLWTLIGTGLLLLIVAGLSLYESRGDAWELSDWPIDDEGEEFESSGDTPSGDTLLGDLELSDDALESPRSWYYSDLHVSLSNFATLKLQLSDEMFSRKVAAFESTLKEVLSLYSGVDIGSELLGDGVYCLRFQSEEQVSDAVFGAVCSAYLMTAKEQKSKIQFQLAANVCGFESGESAGLVGEKGVFINDVLVDSFILERLTLEPAINDTSLIAGFKGAFADLMMRQSEQI